MLTKYIHINVFLDVFCPRSHPRSLKVFTSNDI